ncbi:MAG: hypothetical protein O7A63_01020 [Acidobacteria bacterium]|nr:hypothetical protein [Acidobacteriota bacterium]
MGAEPATALPPARHPLVDKVLAGDAQKGIRLTAARGSLPIPMQDLLYIQICLLKDGDAEVVQQARASLDKVTNDFLIPLLRDPHCDPMLLDHFMRADKLTDRALEIAIAHLATPDPTLEHLASTAPAQTLALIVINEVRIISNPRLLELLRSNPNLDADNRRRLAELEKDFVGRKYEKVRGVPTPEPEVPAAPEEPLPEVPPEEEVPFALPEDEANFEEDVRATPAYQKIMKLNVADRLKLSMMGSAEDRAILIRDSAKMVSLQVLKSPKLNEQEIRTFAGMRSVTEDVLRRIGSHREWTKKYAIAYTLIRNPKTPPGISMPFLGRLGTRDLRTVAGDKNIPELLRRNARNLFVVRTQPPKKIGKKAH